LHSKIAPLAKSGSATFQDGVARLVGQNAHGLIKGGKRRVVLGLLQGGYLHAASLLFGGGGSKNRRDIEAQDLRALEG
jgi:hypothetical protein